MSITLAAVFLGVFCVLGAFDGLYFHMIKFKLHLRPQSRTEHLIHTARAFFFVPIALLFFAFDTRGSLLVFGLFLVLCDLALEVVDILIEKESRRSLGGISSTECAVHVFASSFRMAALAFVMSTKPEGAFVVGPTASIVDMYPLELSVIGLGFAFFSLAGGVISLVAMKKKPRTLRENVLQFERA